VFLPFQLSVITNFINWTVFLSFKRGLCRFTVFRRLLFLWNGAVLWPLSGWGKCRWCFGPSTDHATKRPLGVSKWTVEWDPSLRNASIACMLATPTCNFATDPLNPRLVWVSRTSNFDWKFSGLELHVRICNLAVFYISLKAIFS